MRKLAVLFFIFLASACVSTRTPDSYSACEKTTKPASYECLKKEAQAVSLESGLARGERHVRAWLEKEPHLAAAWCHSLMHDLGYWWVESGGDARDVMSSPYACAGGLLHGAWSAWGDKEMETGALFSMCDRLRDDNPAVMIWDCWHGLGHAEGALVLDSSDIRSTCVGVMQPWVEACLSGVYSAVGSRMSGGSDHGGSHKPLDRNNEWCQGSTGVYYSLCWERQGIMSVRDSLFICPASGLGAQLCAYGQGRGQGQILKEGGVWDRDWIFNTNKNCRETSYPESCFKGVVYEAVLHGEGRSVEDVCTLLDYNLGECLRESGVRRAFELQKPTTWRFKDS